MKENALVKGKEHEMRHWVNVASQSASVVQSAAVTVTGREDRLLQESGQRTSRLPYIATRKRHQTSCFQQTARVDSKTASETFIILVLRRNISIYELIFHQNIDNENRQLFSFQKKSIWVIDFPEFIMVIAIIMELKMSLPKSVLQPVTYIFTLTYFLLCS